MTTEMKIDFTLPNRRLNTDPNFQLPMGWSCDWDNFDGSERLYPCVSGHIQVNIILEGIFNFQRSEIFFVMYRKGSHMVVIRMTNDPTQYYFFNLDTSMLLKLTEHYPTLEAFMEKAMLWVGDDAQINAVTPFQVMEYEQRSRSSGSSFLASVSTFSSD